MKVEAHNEKATKQLGSDLAKELIQTDTDQALVIGLKGELGSGKTTFVKGFANFLDVEEITSPTFVILKKYNIDKEGFSTFYHMDGYRLEAESDLSELNFNQIIQDDEAIILVEWPEKVAPFPEEALTIEFEILEDKARELKVDI